MTQHTLINTVSEEILGAVDEWFQQIERKKEKDVNEIAGRTSLQIGIHDLLHIEYRDGKIKLYSWINGSPDCQHKGTRLENPLAHQEIENALIPLLEKGIRQKLQTYEDSALVNYRFHASIKVGGSETLPILNDVNQRKRELLLQRIQAYIKDKLEGQSYPTDPLESFFLSRHLVDPQLFPDMDTAFIMHVYELVMERNKGNKTKMDDHRSRFIRAFSQWAESVFLPTYFHNVKPGWGRAEYTIKEGIDLTAMGPQQMELVLQTAIMIIKYEPNYSRQNGLDLLERLKELGSTQAVKVIKEGSGTLPAEDIHYKDEQIECQAHDVFSIITIRIKEECADSYAKGLDFICRLLEKGFFRSYQIRLKSQAKHIVSVPGLAKSPTHRFFANALQYEELHPKLETYARLAMMEHEWYEDTEGEKNCMPGTYAVFGLGLANRRYFPLVEAYMERVDDEHQSVQAAFAGAFIMQYGIDETTLPTIAACLLSCQDGKFTKYRDDFETAANLQALAGIMASLAPHYASHLVELIWGSLDNLQKRLQKEKGECADGFAAVRAAANRKG
ncbi:DUF6138 family protein [Paenibacillus eucommiae]|uniref:Uncharacterized protein n=1 Tax=Paenibacillus eucommiae TaxID=1355755 RepID=A0ABS4JAD2_9BACL|nr:DUF6138 family protein [Paenibacillus eucommiae]MBP1996802.1 hypothetical protein [Paenibacillus eucommiae]